MLTLRQTHHNREPPSDRIGRSKTERQQKRKVRSTKETRQKSTRKTLGSRRIEAGRSQALGARQAQRKGTRDRNVSMAQTHQRSTRRVRRRWGHGGSKRGEVKQREEGEPSAWQLRQDGGEGANESARRISGRQQLLFERETEHLWLRQLIHGIGRDPFARA